MKIIDTFIFYNELDMLEYRLNELNNHIDYFVLVEANKTFNNSDKELIFDKNKERFSKYLDKIIHIIIKDMPSGPNPWIREAHQRNCIERGLEILNKKNKLEDSDVIILSDVDEIPNTFLLETIRKFSINDMYNLEQDFYYYNIFCKAQNKWYFPKIGNWENFKKRSPQEIRMMKFEKIFKRGGWHFSYFGDPKFIINKIQEFSHQEFNRPEYKNEEMIKKIIKNCSDLFFRDCGMNFMGPHGFHHVNIENNDFLPKKFYLLNKLNTIYETEINNFINKNKIKIEISEDDKITNVTDEFIKYFYYDSKLYIPGTFNLYLDNKYTNYLLIFHVNEKMHKFEKNNLPNKLLKIDL